MPWQRNIRLVHILERREYTSCTVNFKTYTNSILDKKQRDNPIEKQEIFEDTHEAIIEKDIFDKVQDRHAIINGKLAEYSVHLGSGVVHQIGGAMIPILPVHSQHKGRIFLPFVDDDPKTAEIISKILLLSEDSKIKDSMILSAIKK